MDNVEAGVAAPLLGQQDRISLWMLTGWTAIVTDMLFIAAASITVLACHFLDTDGQYGMTYTLLIPLTAVGLGAVGTLCKGSEVVGLPLSFGLCVTFWLGTLVFVATDLLMRAFLGGDLFLVVSAWAALLASASSANLLALEPLHSLLAVDGEAGTISGFGPGKVIAVVIVQIGQAVLSVLGAPWYVALLQIAMRRLLIVVVVHAISLVNYGTKNSERMNGNSTLEYCCVHIVADHTSSVREHDRIERAAVGKLLLGLPLFGGESFTAGAKSLKRLLGKVVFTEQILSYSSPSFVVSHDIGFEHTGFIQLLQRNEGNPWDVNPDLADAALCKSRVCSFLAGRGLPVSDLPHVIPDHSKPL